MGTIRRQAGPHAWEGVEPTAYSDPSVAGVEKHELIGPAEGARDYRVRYFHVPVGGRTARERHPHDHGVVIVTGRAAVTLGDERHELGPGDVVYVEGDELHCFEALGEEPLGFVCVVPPRRETPGERVRRVLETLDLSDIHPDARAHPPADFPGPSVYSGPEGVRELVAEWTANFDEYRWEVDEVIEGDGVVVALCHHRGRIKDQGGEVRTPVAAVYDDFDGVRPRRTRLYFDWDEARRVAGLTE